MSAAGLLWLLPALLLVRLELEEGGLGELFEGPGAAGSYALCGDPGRSVGCLGATAEPRGGGGVALLFSFGTKKGGGEKKTG